MRTVPLLVLVLVVVSLVAAPGAPAAESRLPTAPSIERVVPEWRARARTAQRAATSRDGRVGWALIDPHGRLVAGWHVHQTFNSASVFKSMLLVCYLRKPDVRDRALTSSERAQLGAMITRSANEPANWLYGRVSQSCLYGLAEEVGMQGFVTSSHWGRTKITPYGTANLFFRIDQRIPRRHRGAAVRWLRGVVSHQRWGLARESIVPPGMTIAFKGGFAGTPGGGRTISQGALFTTDGGGPRLGVAVLTNHSPTDAYGHETIERIGTPLLHGWRPAVTAANPS